jgi:putative transposase
LRDSIQRGWTPGSDRFRRQIEVALGRKVDPPLRGRPRKTPEQEAPDPQPHLL